AVQLPADDRRVPQGMRGLDMNDHVAAYGLVRGCGRREVDRDVLQRSRHLGVDRPRPSLGQCGRPTYGRVPDEGSGVGDLHLDSVLALLETQPGQIEVRTLLDDTAVDRPRHG